MLGTLTAVVGRGFPSPLLVSARALSFVTAAAVLGGGGGGGGGASASSYTFTVLSMVGVPQWWGAASFPWTVTGVRVVGRPFLSSACFTGPLLVAPIVCGHKHMLTLFLLTKMLPKIIRPMVPVVISNSALAMSPYSYDSLAMPSVVRQYPLLTEFLFFWHF